MCIRERERESEKEGGEEERRVTDGVAGRRERSRDVA